MEASHFGVMVCSLGATPVMGAHFWPRSPRAQKWPSEGGLIKRTTVGKGKQRSVSMGERG
jgi:hypothetical protein